MVRHYELNLLSYVLGLTLVNSHIKMLTKAKDILDFITCSDA